MEHVFVQSGGSGFPADVQEMLYDRPRIHALFQDAMKRPLVNVVAGAGYGKTRAVYSFLQNYEASVTWVQLSEMDNHGERFWENFVHAVGQGNPTMAEAFTECGLPQTEDEFSRFLTIPGDLLPPNRMHVVAVDDFHLLREGAALRFIERCINRILPNMKTVIISRTVPDVNYYGLLEKGGVAEINEDALRFTEDEVLGFMKDYGLSEDPAQAAEISEGTQGWALGLKLILQSLKRETPDEKLAISDMRRNIFDYFEREIFTDLQPETRKLMIRIGLVDFLPAELLRMRNFEEMAPDDLKKVSAFIRYDSYLDIYRTHHLFLEFLRQKSDELTREEQHETFGRMAEWCVRNDFRLDALAWLEKMGDYERLLNFCYTLWPMALPFSVSAFLLSILERTPKPVYEKNPRAHILYSRCLLNQGRFEEMCTKVMPVIEEYEKMPSSPFVDRVISGGYLNLAFVGLLTCLVTGNYDFWKHLERADHYYSKGNYETDLNQVGRATPGAMLCRIGVLKKELMDNFLDALEKGIPCMSHAMNGCCEGMTEAARAEYALYRGDISDCVTQSWQAIYKAREFKQYDMENRALLYLLRAALAKGSYEDARNVLTQLDRQLTYSDYINAEVGHEIITGWYYVMIGQPGLAMDWLKSSIVKEEAGTMVSGFEFNTKLKYHLMEGRYDELIACHEADILPFGWRQYALARLELKVAAAVACYHKKDRDRALALLEEASEEARPMGLEMPFIELGAEMRTLTNSALKNDNHSIPREWLEQINRKSAVYAKNLLFVSNAYRKANGLEGEVKLTDREVQLLRHLYHGLSRAEMGERENLSINTVKSSLGIIFSKLGTDNGGEAVRLALERKLI